jgi:hypothetical protein
VADPLRDVPRDAALEWLSRIDRAASEIEGMCNEWRVEGSHDSYRIPHAKAVRDIADELRQFVQDWRRDFGP